MNGIMLRVLSPRHQPAWRGLLAVLVLVVAWFAFSATTGTDAFEHADKVKHVLAFGIMASVASLGWAASRSTGLRIAGALVLYGAFIEVVQFFIPGRDASVLDLVADAVGVAAGLLAVRAARLGLRQDNS